VLQLYEYTNTPKGLLYSQPVPTY